MCTWEPDRGRKTFELGKSLNDVRLFQKCAAELVPIGVSTGRTFLLID